MPKVVARSLKVQQIPILALDTYYENLAHLTTFSHNYIFCTMGTTMHILELEYPRRSLWSSSQCLALGYKKIIACWFITLITWRVPSVGYQTGPKHRGQGKIEEGGRPFQISRCSFNKQGNWHTRYQPWKAFSLKIFKLWRCLDPSPFEPDLLADLVLTGEVWLHTAMLLLWFPFLLLFPWVASLQTNWHPCCLY